MKTFDGLFEELKAKAASHDPASGTVKELARGKHFIGKKVVEEAGEVWIAAEYEGKEKTAEEKKVEILKAFNEGYNNFYGIEEE